MNKPRATLITFSMLLSFLYLSPCGFTQDEPDIKEMYKQMQEMQKRIEQLEQQNAQLRENVKQQGAKSDEINQRQDMIEEQASTVETHAIRSSIDAEIYGYIKADASYDSARMENGNQARWVVPQMGNDDDFNLGARQTRLGIKFNGPDFGGAQSGGRVEVDFSGGGGENSNALRMRHAYVQMDWPEYDFSILAGQTADIISPLVPDTVNFAVHWWAGNVGVRRPQLRLTKDIAMSEDVDLTIQAGVVRTIGDSVLGFDPGDTGEDAGFPTVQGRIAATFPLFTDQPSTIGLSGHWGQEEIDLNASNLNQDIDTWSGNIDITLPLLEKLRFTGEGWIGENMDAYAGGVGQGIHFVDRDGLPANGNEFPASGIQSKGGWAAFSIGPWGDFIYNAGASIDDPDDGDLNAGGRADNMGVFGNVFWKLSDPLLTALEVSYWNTGYKNRSDEDSFRLHAAVIYKF